MHYDGTLRGFFSDDHPIMKDKITGNNIGVNTNMSQMDIQKLNDMYPCRQIDSACGKCSAILFYDISGLLNDSND